MYDECKRSNEIIVCHTLWSILWLIVQVCSLTMEYQVFQYVPSISIFEQFEGKLLTILPRNSILLLWNDGRQCMELILCRVVESSCLPTHSVVPHISWHDLPCHKTMKRYSDFPNMVIFQLLLRKVCIQTWYIFDLFYIVFECIPSTHGQGMMLVLPNQLPCLVLSTSDAYFLSSHFDVIHIHR